MLRRIRRFGRITVCGAISGYNDSNVHNLTHWNEVISNRLTLQGFIVSDYLHRMEESNKALVQTFKEGKINLDGGETLEKVPFEEIPRVWGRLFDGTHTGKLITEIVNN
jgi:NADPH-dependent curcumin reductase CurA